MGPEKQFETKVKKYLDGLGAWQIKFFANKFTKKGVPDVLCCLNGCFIGLEIKAKNGKPSDLQLYNQEQIRKAGGIAIILYPHQFAALKELCAEIMIGRDYDAYRHQFDFDIKGDEE